MTYVETALLGGRVGEIFAAVVVDVREGRATVQIAESGRVGPLEGDGAPAGESLTVRLSEADAAADRVRFVRA